METDHYAHAGVPFYDLWHLDGHVPAVRGALPPVLAGVRRGVLEIGAGTGLITEAIARATPADVYAVEPSAAMRAVLLSRLAADPGLLARVTVLPYGALDVDVDEPVEAVVMIAVLHSFDAAGRAALWPTLARQLEPGGLLVLNWADRAAPVPGNLELMGEYHVGRHVYRVLGQVLEADGESSRGRYLYQILQRGVVISEAEVVSDSHRPARDRLEAEVAAAGFAPAQAPDGLLAWRLRK